MRLICPECSAQYEVDDGVVPKNGRDVQCSSCGHTWFQKPADTSVKPNRPAKAEPNAASLQDTSEETATEDATRRELPSEVTDILRSEANRETAERVAEGSSATSKANAGLAETTAAATAATAAAAVAANKTEDAVKKAMSEPEPTRAAPSNSDLRNSRLPDIEEINSTLDATQTKPDLDPAVIEKQRRSGFRRGFTWVMVLFAILALIYVFAPQIVEKFPQTRDVMVMYVERVDALRVVVDGFMQVAIEKLTALLSNLSGSE